LTGCSAARRVARRARSPAVALATAVPMPVSPDVLPATAASVGMVASPDVRLAMVAVLSPDVRLATAVRNRLAVLGMAVPTRGAPLLPARSTARVRSSVGCSRLSTARRVATRAARAAPAAATLSSRAAVPSLGVVLATAAATAAATRPAVLTERVSHSLTTHRLIARPAG
jgi:hypothetical protein